MKRRFAGWCLALLIMTGCAGTYGQTDVEASAKVSSPGTEVSVSYFYDALSPYGQWVQVPEYGWCWTPYDVAVEWRPYSDGHWVYTDYGWCWVANETWGWAPYHYGRWTFDDTYGWMWVPGTVWAPAWVAWCSSDDWVGWAPLPPAATWDVSVGLTYSNARAIPSEQWCFVPQRRMLDANVRVQVTPVARNVTLLRRSRDLTKFALYQGRPANVSLDPVRIQREIGRPVPREKIVDVDAPGRGHGRPAGAGAIALYRPVVQPAPAREAQAPEVIQRRAAIPDEVMQRKRDEQQRRLESDINSERARLQREQQNELRARGPAAPAADEVRQRHAAEQQAFEAHAAQQRRVFEHRMQQQIVRPEVARNSEKPDKPDKPQKNKGKGQGKDGG